MPDDSASFHRFSIAMPPAPICLFVFSRSIFHRSRFTAMLYMAVLIAALIYLPRERSAIFDFSAARAHMAHDARFLVATGMMIRVSTAYFGFPPPRFRRIPASPPAAAFERARGAISRSFIFDFFRPRRRRASPFLARARQLSAPAHARVLAIESWPLSARSLISMSAQSFAFGARHISRARARHARR